MRPAAKIPEQRGPMRLSFLRVAKSRLWTNRCTCSGTMSLTAVLLWGS